MGKIDPSKFSLKGRTKKRKKAVRMMKLKGPKKLPKKTKYG